MTNVSPREMTEISDEAEKFIKSDWSVRRGKKENFLFLMSFS